MLYDTLRGLALEGEAELDERIDYGTLGALWQLAQVGEWGMAQLPSELESMTPSERLDLIEQLWESLSEDSLPVTEPQRQELRERLQAIESGQLRTVPLEQAIAAIRAGRA